MASKFIAFRSFYFIWLLLLISTTRILSQEIHGTLIVIIKYDSGIIVCSDTRGTVLENRKQIFTFDLKQKIFQVGKNLVAFKGLSMANDTLLGHYLEYVKDEDLPPVKMIQNIIQTFGEKLPQDQFNRLTEETTVFVAGYHDSMPEICFTQPGWKGGIISSTYAESEECFDSIEKVKFRNLPFSETIKLIEEIYIRKSISDTSIGGPTVVWKIDEKTKDPMCIQNCVSNNLICARDIYKAMLQGEIKVTPVQPNNDEDIRSYLIKNINKE